MILMYFFYLWFMMHLKCLIINKTVFSSILSTRYDRRTVLSFFFAYLCSTHLILSFLASERTFSKCGKTENNQIVNKKLKFSIGFVK